MKFTCQLLLYTALILTVLSESVFGQNIKDIKLDQKLSILNNRAFFTFPAGSKNVARSADIMAADPNSNQETRIIFDLGKMRLVFYATEEYKLGDENLFSEITKERSLSSFKKQLLINKDKVLAVLITPTVFDTSKEAILINSLLIKTQDNTIFKIAAYINPDAFKNKDAFAELSRRVFDSLEKGTRINDLKAKEDTVNIFGTKKSFKLSLPTNYCVTIDKKNDFQVIHFHKYTIYADTSWLSLIIYTGNYPSLLYNEYGFDGSAAKIIPGTFLSRKVNWMIFYDNKKNIYIKEQKIAVDDIENGLIAHIAMATDKMNSIQALTSIIESVKLLN